LLNLKTSTPNFMLYGELGRYPLNVTVKLKILSFWSRLIDGKQSKLSSLIYRLLYLKTHVLSINHLWLIKFRVCQTFEYPQSSSIDLTKLIHEKVLFQILQLKKKI
jgi:hypothetical protein